MLLVAYNASHGWIVHDRLTLVFVFGILTLLIMGAVWKIWKDLLSSPIKCRWDSRSIFGCQHLLHFCFDLGSFVVSARVSRSRQLCVHECLLVCGDVPDLADGAGFSISKVCSWSSCISPGFRWIESSSIDLELRLPIRCLLCWLVSSPNIRTPTQSIGRDICHNGHIYSEYRCYNWDPHRIIDAVVWLSHDHWNFQTGQLHSILGGARHFRGRTRSDLWSLWCVLFGIPRQLEP